MNHAVLGAGAVGGLIAALLADASEDVTLVLRSDDVRDGLKGFTLQRSDGSSLQGPVRCVTTLSENDGIDVLWVATKAMHLVDALQKARGSSPRAVVPLLNGFEHLQTLERRFGRNVVFPATIAVEAERVRPGVVRQLSTFLRLRLAARGSNVLSGVAEAIGERGADVKFEADEIALLWSKLVFLAPFALATSASGMPAGALREDVHWRSLFEMAANEVAKVAHANGASLSSEGAIAMLHGAHYQMRSSMAKDIEAGRETELDAIAVAIVRSADAHGIKVPTLQHLIHEVTKANEN